MCEHTSMACRSHVAGWHRGAILLSPSTSTAAERMCWSSRHPKSLAAETRQTAQLEQNAGGFALVNDAVRQVPRTQVRAWEPGSTEPGSTAQKPSAALRSMQSGPVRSLGAPSQWRARCPRIWSRVRREAWGTSSQDALCMKNDTGCSNGAKRRFKAYKWWGTLWGVKVVKAAVASPRHFTTAFLDVAWLRAGQEAPETSCGSQASSSRTRPKRSSSYSM